MTTAPNRTHAADSRGDRGMDIDDSAQTGEPQTGEAQTGESPRSARNAGGREERLGDQPAARADDDTLMNADRRPDRHFAQPSGDAWTKIPHGDERTKLRRESPEGMPPDRATRTRTRIAVGLLVAAALAAAGVVTALTLNVPAGVSVIVVALLVAAVGSWPVWAAIGTRTVERAEAEDEASRNDADAVVTSRQ